MDDAFTLLRRAADLLPEHAVAENGQTVGDVREEIEFQEWEMALDVPCAPGTHAGTATHGYIGRWPYVGNSRWALSSWYPG
ncbi:hypothetical protein [Streptomyces rugosispiralis]|uniref:Uncharacterized protein n=1 Tax=Streptomyces rugosispiralis TaxID=2967341 RepID=A0ABT1VBC6_9ACTN|nr:hypothetical protein [Streptomyces rugosispiralis]MCQ8193816.1 hypothetical protein [Streptomyces rugosispiralis]